LVWVTVVALQILLTQEACRFEPTFAARVKCIGRGGMRLLWHAFPEIISKSRRDVYFSLWPWVKAFLVTSRTPTAFCANRTRFSSSAVGIPPLRRVTAHFQHKFPDIFRTKLFRTRTNTVNTMKANYKM